MKKLMLFAIISIMFTFQYCSPKTTSKSKSSDRSSVRKLSPNNMAAEHLEILTLNIDSMEINAYVNDQGNLSEVIVDSLVIDERDLHNSTDLKTKNGTATLTTFTLKQKVALSPVNKGTSLKNVPIGEVRFKTVIIKRSGFEDQIFNDVPVYGVRVKNALVAGFENPEEYIQQLEKELNASLEEIIDRLNLLKKVVGQKVEQQKYHVFRTLPDTLNSIEKQIYEIRDFYAMHEHIDLYTLRVDMNRLENMHITFDDIEAAASPENDVTILEYSILFDLGQYEIKENIDQSIFQIHINKVVTDANNLLSKHHDREVEATLAITGFADDVDVLPSTAQQMYKELGLADNFYNGDQQKLNELLSDLRAQKIYDYLAHQIQMTLNNPRLRLKRSCVGEGQNPPVGYQGGCIGNCPDRRIAYVSQMALSKTGN